MADRDRADAVRRMAKQKQPHDAVQLSNHALSASRELPSSDEAGYNSHQASQDYNDDLRSVKQWASQAVVHAKAGRSKEAAQLHNQAAQFCRLYAGETGEPHAERFNVAAEAHEAAAKAHKKVK